MIEQRKLLRLLKLIGLLGSARRRTVAELADVLEASPPTVYRYLELLQEVGFDIRTNELHQHFLASQNPPKNTLLQLSLEEAQLLQSLVRGAHTPMQQSLQNKIYTGSELAECAYNIEKARVGLCYRQLQQAMAERKQVVLVHYFSENSNEVRNRKAEPIRLLDEDLILEAFDTEKKQIRHFKLERMEEVKLLDTPFRFKHKHQHASTDPFGVSDHQNVKVKLKLSQIGRRRLLEEFPACAAFLKANGKGSYFEAEVNAGFKLLDRFLLSYCDEVKVLEPETLKKHLEMKWKKKTL